VLAILLYLWTQPPAAEAEIAVNAPTEEELEKAKQIMEIFNLPENAAIVALRRNKFALV
jgi:hypothetical protein